MSTSRSSNRVPRTASIGELATSRDNNFNLIRFVAATAVLLSHCWPLTRGNNDAEPMARVVAGMTMGTSAVLVFFAISGFLVASSWDRSRSTYAFLVARGLRIYPGLVVMLVVSVLVAGPLLTRLPTGAYFSTTGTWTYLPSNLLLAMAQLTLPGVLEGSTYRVLNGSLWTLAYEVACYLALLAAGLANGLARTTFLRTLLFFVAVGLLLSLMPGADTKGFANKVLLLGPPFLLGVCAWVWRASIRLSGPIALAIGAGATGAMLIGVPGAHLLFSLAVAYGALYVALVPAGPIRAFNRFGDCSYGMYIYAFPVQQFMHSRFPELQVAGLFLAAFAATLPLAAISWVAIEKPALEWSKAHLATRRRAVLRSSAT